MLSPTPLTIFVLTHNRKLYLRKALESIRSQTYRHFLVNILDNASTDGTDQIVEPFLEDTRFQYIRHKSNIGAIGNLVFALRECMTDFVLVTHDDDMMRPDMVLREMELLGQTDDINLACCDNDLIDEKDEVLQSKAYDTLFSLGNLFFQDRYEFIDGYICGLNYISCPTAMLRTSAVRKIDLDALEDSGPAIDSVLWMEMNTQPGRFVFIGESLYEYRLHSEQDSSRNVLAIHSGLKKKVSDILSRENFDPKTLRVWEKKVDRNIIASLRNYALSVRPVSKALLEQVKSSAIEHNRAGIGIRWIFFLCRYLPWVFQSERQLKNAVSLAKKIFKHLRKLAYAHLGRAD